MQSSSVINNIRRTYAITFPRSGHHALVRVLQEYFKTDLVYNEPYLEPTGVMSKNPRVNLQKTHDYHGTFKRPPGFPIIVQARNPLLSIDSRHKLNVREFNHPDTRAQWLRLHHEQLVAWMSFAKRWILSEEPDRLVVFYEDLVAQPVAVCQQVISFLRPEEQPDINKLRSALAIHTIEYRKQAIKFYNRA